MSGEARRYLMIGAPITSLRTPPLLERRLRQLGIAAKVEARHLDPEDLAAFMAEARADAGLAGLMVTMPHKRAIVPLLDQVAAVVRRAGSVNAVKRHPEGRLLGAQFDGLGLVRALRGKGATIEGARVLLMGVGGAGTAIADALVRAGCARLDLVDLDRARARLVAGQLNAAAGREVARGRERVGDGYHILINATPLGMGEGDPSPLPPAIIGARAVVADIVADPPRTALAAQAQAAGAVLVTGRDTVEGQIEPIAAWLLGDALEP